MKRLISLLIFAPLFAAGLPGAAGGAQLDTASDIDPRLAGYPTLTVRLTEDRIDAPAAAAAGRTLLIEEQTGTGVGHAFVFRIPDDVAEAAIVDALAGGPAAEETPVWFWRAEFVGNGDRAVTDRPAMALVDLKPGRYIVGDPYRPAKEYARFTVTGAGDARRALLGGPQADVSGELFEMGFHLPEKFAAGRQVWEVRNSGAMLHEIALFPVPTGATAEQIETAMTAELEVERGGDPAAGRATVDQLGPEWTGWTSQLVAGVGVLSPQRVSLAQITLQPGTFGAVCFIPDPGTGTPHLMLGMTAVFTVETSTT